jgi:hypothetical protein
LSEAVLTGLELEGSYGVVNACRKDASILTLMVLDMKSNKCVYIPDRRYWRDTREISGDTGQKNNPPRKPD